MKSDFGAILAAIVLSGCTSSAVQRVDDGFENFFARVEGLPAYAQSLESAPLEVVMKGKRGWREYEIGRRYEYGLGLPKDVACAKYWYSWAAHSRYEIYDMNPAWGVNPPLVTRYGLPWARIGFQRLGGDIDRYDRALDQRCRTELVGQG